MEANDSTTNEKCFESLPTAREFFLALEDEHKIVLTIPLLCAVLTLLVYSFNLRRVLTNNVKTTKCNVTTLISIYPVSSIWGLFLFLVRNQIIFNKFLFWVLADCWLKRCYQHFSAKKSFVSRLAVTHVFCHRVVSVLSVSKFSAIR